MTVILRFTDNFETFHEYQKLLHAAIPQFIEVNLGQRAIHVNHVLQMEQTYFGNIILSVRGGGAVPVVSQDKVSSLSVI